MDIERAAKEYISGKSLKSLARERRCAPVTLRAQLVELGIDIRRRGGGGDHGQRKNWKGGRHIDQQGYAWVHESKIESEFLVMKHGNYIAEHRLVMARYLGRPLIKTEQVHHIDGNRQNNAIENLQLRIKSHGSGAAFRCRDCGSVNVAAEGLI